MRADAQKNYDQLLTVASGIVIRDGADASLRDIARQAGVGLGTLYRHFPTREALFEALLRKSFDELAVEAVKAEQLGAADAALLSWLRKMVGVAHSYRGVVALMVAAIEDPASALHASCVAMKAAGTKLLTRAQSEGTARGDIDGADVFALVGALAWMNDQPSIAPRADHLFSVITRSLLTR